MYGMRGFFLVMIFSVAVIVIFTSLAFLQNLKSLHKTWYFNDDSSRMKRNAGISTNVSKKVKVQYVGKEFGMLPTETTRPGDFRKVRGQRTLDSSEGHKRLETSALLRSVTRRKPVSPTTSKTTGDTRKQGFAKISHLRHIGNTNNVFDSKFNSSNTSTIIRKRMSGENSQHLQTGNQSKTRSKTVNTFSAVPLNISIHKKPNISKNKFKGNARINVAGSNSSVEKRVFFPNDNYEINNKEVLRVSKYSTQKRLFLTENSVKNIDNLTSSENNNLFGK